MLRQLLFIHVALFLSLLPLHGEPPPPVARPEAVYTPAPVYRPEWARQGLAGKGVVLVTIDKGTGKVTGARMQESTGNQLLDGAALQAYSQWRFKPGSATQLRIPIEFKKAPARPAAPPGRPAGPPGRSQPILVYVLMVLLGFGAATLVARRRRR